MAVMSWELYEGLLETLEVLSDPELIKQYGFWDGKGFVNHIGCLFRAHWKMVN